MNNRLITLDKLVEELNNEQKTAVSMPINSSTKIIAGAGTGKTKIISKRYVKLILDLIEKGNNHPSENILVITFTDKAAQEMKERIFKELKANEIEITDSDWVSTFHSFCSKILRQHSIEANLSPKFTIGNNLELKEIFENIIQKIKFNEIESIENLQEILQTADLMPETLDTKEIIKISEASELDDIFKNIFEIIQKIKAQGLNPKEFKHKTTKSTLEFSNTVKTIPFKHFDGSKFETKDDYIINWQKHLKAYLNNDFTDENLTKTAAAKIILDKNGASKPEKWSCCLDFNLIDKTTEIEIKITNLITAIYAIYQAELERLDVIDFDDLINKTIYILETNQEIRKYYQNQFKHIIIDEFQDSNTAQLRLILLLMAKDAPNITYVGDRKQSIYGFRYAQMENLDVLEQEIEKRYNKKYEPIQLKTNYRSTSQILQAVNYITQSLMGLDESLYSSEKNNKSYEKFLNETIIDDQGGDIEFLQANYIAEEILKLKKAHSEAKFSDFAILIHKNYQAELISKQLSQKGIPSIKSSNDSFFKDITIKTLLSCLKLANNIRDEIALIKILQGFLTDKELYQLKIEIDKNISKIEIEPEKQKRLYFSERLFYFIELDLIKHLKLTQKTLQTIDLLNAATKEINRSKNLIHCFEYLAPRLKTNSSDPYQTGINLMILEKVITDFIRSNANSSIYKFIKYFENIAEDSNFKLPEISSATDIDGVEIITLHKSKGLEFKYVFLINPKKDPPDTSKVSFDLQYGDKPGFGLIINNFYNKKSPKNLLYRMLWDGPKAENEKIRKFYVALSRAEQYLNIISNQKPCEEYYQNFPDFVTKNSIEKQDTNA